MSDMHEVVDLRPLADDRRAECRTVDADVCADLHVVLDHDAADLRHLGMHARLRRKAEAVRSNDGTAVNGAARPDPAVLAHDRARIEHRLIPDLAVLADIGVRVDGHARAEHGVIVDIGKGKDGHVRPDFHIPPDIRRVAHAVRMLDRGSKDREQLCKGGLRVVHIDDRPRKALRARRQEQRARPRRTRRVDMRRNGKGKIVRPRLFERGEAPDHARSVAADGAADECRSLTDCLFHASRPFYWSF